MVSATLALETLDTLAPGKLQHAAAQIEHRGFKRKTGAGVWLVKQSGKLLPLQLSE